MKNSWINQKNSSKMLNVLLLSVLIPTASFQLSILKAHLLMRLA